MLYLDMHNDYWALDSGASCHATSHKCDFIEYVHENFGHTRLGNDYLCKILGIGKVRIMLPNGKWWVLKNVRHITTLKRNLISASQLDNEGQNFAFENKTWKVSKGSIMIDRGDLVGSLYFLSNASNNIVDLAFTGGNVNKGHHKVGMKGQVGLNKIRKGVSNGYTKKFWVPKMHGVSKEKEGLGDVLILGGLID